MKKPVGLLRCVSDRYVQTLLVGKMQTKFGTFQSASRCFLDVQFDHSCLIRWNQTVFVRLVCAVSMMHSQERCIEGFIEFLE